MMETIRLTAAQAMMRWLSVQMTEDGQRFIEGVWAIFGHGNVAGIGEALKGIGDALPPGRAASRGDRSKPGRNDLCRELGRRNGHDTSGNPA
ncbi:Epi-inositol hydrolase [Rubellimicrobium mesophilum DSM 19309]|uniref:Epi-inositol hydrolase n=1 Tax=Rubellimicrobium mesophilum DSM 19309 TaxID=442562 RepID=A0A017HNK4_9RHOB|nr:hypothetical protein [Rubellimicrobium mesophilum]EYD75900.1 Epi-inositol hydrolase [Rubellimicrobium mesophilum DSM 19309]